MTACKTCETSVKDRISIKCYLHQTNLDLKGAGATYVESVTEMKKCFRLKDMLDFNVL